MKIRSGFVSNSSSSSFIFPFEKIPSVKSIQETVWKDCDNDLIEVEYYGLQDTHELAKHFHTLLTHGNILSEEDMSELMYYYDDAKSAKSAYDYISQYPNCKFYQVDFTEEEALTDTDIFKKYPNKEI
jgi:predicted  nucleic acid-binding Zn ribbon protein